MIDDGGPAFPQTNEQRYNDPIHGVIRPSDIYGNADPGLSKRDWFAATAREIDYSRWVNIMADNGVSVSREEAKYLYADAMIKARKELK